MRKVFNKQALVTGILLFSIIIISSSLVIAGEINSINTTNFLTDKTAMLTGKFQFKVIDNFSTYNSFYNVNLSRQNSNYKVSQNECLFFGTYKLSNRINVGLVGDWKSYKIGARASRSTEVLKFQNTPSSSSYLKYLGSQVKILLIKRKFDLVFLSSYFLSPNNLIRLKYNDKTLRDRNCNQWLNQLMYGQEFSKYFSLNVQLDANYKTPDIIKNGKMRFSGAVTPAFTYYLGSDFNFYCFLHLNPAISNGFFSTFNFKEGVGCNYKISSKFAFDFQYSYTALGKKADEVKNFMTGIRYNF